MKKSIRADKQKYVEDITLTVQKAARERNIKQLNLIKKKLEVKYSKPERPVNNKEGKTISEIQEQRKRWIERFEELLNRPAPLNLPDIRAAHTNPHIVVTPPTIEEIRMASHQTIQE